MTREVIEAIEYIKAHRKLDENLYNLAPPNSVSLRATKKCLEYWDMAIKALEKELCDDCVSREAVIETLKDVFDEYEVFLFGVCGQLPIKCVKAIYFLPSVQPNREKHDEEVIKETVASIWGKPPCDDAISRKDALASIKNLYPDMPIVNIMGARQKWLEKYASYFECENAIEQLPLVYPQNTDVLDKIRAEIEQVAEEENKHDQKWAKGLKYALKIIDKYRGEKNENS